MSQVDEKTCLPKALANVMQKATRSRVLAPDDEELLIHGQILAIFRDNDTHARHSGSRRGSNRLKNNNNTISLV